MVFCFGLFLVLHSFLHFKRSMLNRRRAQDGRVIVHDEASKTIFFKRMMVFPFETMTMTGFDCFRQYFVDVNAMEGMPSPFITQTLLQSSTDTRPTHTTSTLTVHHKHITSLHCHSNKHFITSTHPLTRDDLFFHAQARFASPSPRVTARSASGRWSGRIPSAMRAYGRSPSTRAGQRWSGRPRAFCTTLWTRYARECKLHVCEIIPMRLWKREAND